MERLKIALVVDHFLPEIGGIEIQVSELAKGLTRRGHSVQVLTACPRSTSFDNVLVRNIKGRRTPRSEVFYSPDFLTDVAAILHQEKFDIVHCHSSIFSPLAYGTAYLCQKHQIASVLTNHSLFSIGSTLVFRLSAPFLRYARWPLILSAVSSPAAQRLARAFPKNPVQVLPNAVDPDFWKIEPQPHPKLRVVTVGRLHRKKNPKGLIESIPLINHLIAPFPPPIFTVIGDGPERAMLESLACRLGVREQVEFLGACSQSQIREHFSVSDIFALASCWESQSISILEASAAGLPIVAMKRGGVPDLVQDGVEGLLAETPEQFANGIAQLLTQANTRKTMGENAKRNAVKFSWDQVLDKNLQLYHEARIAFGMPAPQTPSHREHVA